MGIATRLVLHAGLRAVPGLRLLLLLVSPDSASLGMAVGSASSAPFGGSGERPDQPAASLAGGILQSLFHISANELADRHGPSDFGSCRRPDSTVEWLFPLEHSAQPGCTDAYYCRSAVSSRASQHRGKAFRQKLCCLLSCVGLGFPNLLASGARRVAGDRTHRHRRIVDHSRLIVCALHRVGTRN